MGVGTSAAADRRVDGSWWQVALFACSIGLATPALALAARRVVERFVVDGDAWGVAAGYAVVAAVALPGIRLLARLPRIDRLSAASHPAAVVAMVIAVVYAVGLWDGVIAFGDGRSATAVDRGWPLVIIGLIGTALVSPVVEEVWFRGLLYRALRSRLVRTAPASAVMRLLKIAPAAFVSSVLFAVSHYLVVDDIGMLLATLPVGLAFTLLYEFTGRLRMAVLAHVVVNATAAVNVEWGAAWGIATLLATLTVTAIAALADAPAERVTN